MPDNQAGEQQRTWKRGVPISTALNFTPEGLVLGAGTVLLHAEGVRRPQRLAGHEARVLALLSAAYARAVTPSVLGNIERAAKAWRENDDCLAYIHLAHARLGELQYPHDAAQRLVIVDAFLKAGGSPRTIFEALKVGRSYIEALEKDYNPDEPRVPSGSGKPSGEWTRDGAPSAPPLPSYLAPGAASWLGDLAPAAAASLGEFAATVMTGAVGAAATLGLLFFPSPNNIRTEGEVAGIPGLHYSWNRDEAVLHLTYDDPNGGQRAVAAYLDGDVFRDEQGRVIGRVIGGNSVAIDAIAALPDLAKDGGPRLCPAPIPDVPGSDQGKPYEENRSRQYEDYVKAFINPPPDGPTPSGYVYALPNLEQGGKPVTYDDCQKKTGIMFEIKGEGYAQLLQNPITRQSVTEEFLDKAKRQVEASGGRPVIWIIAEPEVATYVQKLFADAENEGVRKIVIVHLNWVKREP